MIDTTRHAQIVALAAAHGLTITADSLRFNEAGLDYQVVFAEDHTGQQWVLRMPRRPDVAAKIADESLILEFVRPHLDVSVPDWQVQSPELIAYPALPGSPGLTLNDAGGPVWHVDPESAAYARSYGRVLAGLHSIDTAAPADAGIPAHTPAGVRQEWRDTLTTVAAEFTIADHLRAAWTTWLADDGLWPHDVTFTHGEFYPAHLLLSPDDAIESILDWTTARVGDAAVDFTLHHTVSSPETFQLTVDAYSEITGRVPSRLAERCAAIMAAAPLTYALFALTSGEPEHASTAALMLNP